MFVGEPVLLYCSLLCSLQKPEDQAKMVIFFFNRDDAKALIDRVCIYSAFPAVHGLFLPCANLLCKLLCDPKYYDIMQ